MRKPAFRICKNKDAGQLRSNCAADQRLCFRYIRIVQSIYYLNPKFQAHSHLLWLFSPVCVEPGRKPRRPFFSQRGSNYNIYSHRYILVKSFNRPLVFFIDFLQSWNYINVLHLHSRIGKHVCKRYHTTAEYNSKNCIREALMNECILILKKSQEFHWIVG